MTETNGSVCRILADVTADQADMASRGAAELRAETGVARDEGPYELFFGDRGPAFHE